MEYNFKKYDKNESILLEGYVNDINKFREILKKCNKTNLKKKYEKAVAFCVLANNFRSFEHYLLDEGLNVYIAYDKDNNPIDSFISTEEIIELEEQNLPGLGIHSTYKLNGEKPCIEYSFAGGEGNQLWSIVDYDEYEETNEHFKILRPEEDEFNVAVTFCGKNRAPIINSKQKCYNGEVILLSRARNGAAGFGIEEYIKYVSEVNVDDLADSIDDNLLYNSRKYANKEETLAQISTIINQNKDLNKLLEKVNMVASKPNKKSIVQGLIDKLKGLDNKMDEKQNSRNK